MRPEEKGHHTRQPWLCTLPWPWPPGSRTRLKQQAHELALGGRLVQIPPTDEPLIQQDREEVGMTWL